MSEEIYEITFGKDDVLLSRKDVITPIERNKDIKVITDRVVKEYIRYKRENNTEKVEPEKDIFVFLTKTVKNCIIQKYTNIEGKIKSGTKRDSINDWEIILGYILSKIHSHASQLKMYISNTAFNYYIDDDDEITGSIVLKTKPYKFIILFDRHLQFTIRLEIRCPSFLF